MNDLPVISLNWENSYRIIPTLFPEKTLFDEICSYDELEYVYYIESLTNNRIAKASKFNTDNFGAYYASKDLQTAIYETVYHREKFYAENNAPPAPYHMRVYDAKIKGDNFYDITEKDIYEKYYDPENYTESQNLGIESKKENKDGIVYLSVRHDTGVNIAVLRPKIIIPPAKISKNLIYYWDGKKISTVTDLGKGKNLLSCNKK